MGTRKLSNISLKDFRKFLKNEGLNLIKEARGRGGHEKWSKTGMMRPITIQTHIDPVPEFIVKQVLRHLNINRKDFLNKIIINKKMKG